MKDNTRDSMKTEQVYKIKKRRKVLGGHSVAICPSNVFYDLKH